MLNDDSTRTTDKQRGELAYNEIHHLVGVGDPDDKLTDKCFCYAEQFPLKSKDGYLIEEKGQKLNKLVQIIQNISNIVKTKQN